MMKKMRTVFIVLLLQSTIFLNLINGRKIERIYKGSDDTGGKYPYVVALVDSYRHCTGTLISPNWVLTAAHCLWHSSQVQFGNMSIHPTEAKTRTILKMVVPPFHRFSTNDIGLLRVSSISMKQFGLLSGVDYKAILGHSVQYAGFGVTTTIKVNKSESYKDDIRPLQVGDGVVTQCEFQPDGYTLGPFLCVSPRCSNKMQDTLPGDSGGPLFIDGKLVAVLHGGPVSALPISYYTPVSPYLQWIYDVMHAKPNFPDFEQALVALMSKQFLQQKLQINSAIHGWYNAPLIQRGLPYPLALDPKT